ARREREVNKQTDKTSYCTGDDPRVTGISPGGNPDGALVKHSLPQRRIAKFTGSPHVAIASRQAARGGPQTTSGDSMKANRKKHGIVSNSRQASIKRAAINQKPRQDPTPPPPASIDTDPRESG